MTDCELRSEASLVVIDAEITARETPQALPKALQKGN